MAYTGTGKSLEFVNSSYNLAVGIAKLINIKSEMFKTAFDQLLNMVKPSKIHRNVVCHGDLWTNNLMFTDDKPLPKCVLVDFQIARYAPLALDILHLLYMNTTREFRRKFEKELVEHYHTELEKTVKDCDSTKGAKVPTLQEVFDSVEDLRCYGAIVGSINLPLSLLDSKIATECTKAADDYDKFIFGDRQKLTLSVMEKDEFFKSRLEEIIIELAELSERLQA